LRIQVLEKKEIKFEFEQQMKIYKDLLNEGENNEQNSRWEQALNIYLNAEKIVKKYGSKLEIGNLYYRLGKVFAQKGNLKESLNNLKEALNFLKKAGGTPLQIAAIKEATGEAYKINGKLVEAKEQYQEALKILNAEKERVVYTHSHMTIKILEAIAQQLNNIGEIYLLLNDWDEALENCREGLKVALDTKTASIVLKARLAIAKVYLEKRDNNSAIDYLLNSIDIAKKDQNEKDLLNIYLEIANIYKIQDDTKLAFDYYKNCLKLAEKLDNQHIITKIYDEMGILYSKKGNNKKALEFFKKSYDIGSKLNQYYFEYILYHLALLQYTNKNFDDSYEKLQESYKFAERINNKELLIKIMIKIGDIWKNRNNYDDSIYYYKKALELTKETEKKIIILYKIGRSYQKMKDYTNANDYLLKAFKQLRLYILSIEKIDRKKELLHKFSRIPKILCILNCILYIKTKNLEVLKEAIGFLEFFKDGPIPSELNPNFDKQQCPEREQNLIKITEKCSDLKNLKQQYDLENNFKIKERLSNQIEEIGEEILALDENTWELCNEPNDNFPINGKRIIERLFQTAENSSESWVVLNFFYPETINALFIFLIDIQKKNLLFFGKKLNKTILNSLLKLKVVKKLDNSNEEQEKYMNIFNQFANLWEKITPYELTAHLFEQTYTHLTIIPYSFLWKLPWEMMQINGQYLNELFTLSRNFSLDYFRLDFLRKRE